MKDLDEMRGPLYILLTALGDTNLSNLENEYWGCPATL